MTCLAGAEALFFHTTLFQGATKDWQRSLKLAELKEENLVCEESVE